MRQLAVKLAIAGAGAAVLVAAYLWFFPTQSSEVVAIGQPIQQDDFLYTVDGVTKAKSIGSGETRTSAHGTFYVATIKVENRALRVDYRWDPSIVYVVDAAGHRYEMSVEGQQSLDAARHPSLIVPAGMTARFQVAFDLPAGVQRPALAFSNGILMGDLFNGAAYMRARVPLE